MGSWTTKPDEIEPPSLPPAVIFLPPLKRQKMTMKEGGISFAIIPEIEVSTNNVQFIPAPPVATAFQTLNRTLPIGSEIIMIGIEACSCSNPLPVPIKIQIDNLLYTEPFRNVSVGHHSNSENGAFDDKSIELAAIELNASYNGELQTTLYKSTLPVDMIATYGGITPEILNSYIMATFNNTDIGDDVSVPPKENEQWEFIDKRSILFALITKNSKQLGVNREEDIREYIDVDERTRQSWHKLREYYFNKKEEMQNEKIYDNNNNNKNNNILQNDGDDDDRENSLTDSSDTASQESEDSRESPDDKNTDEHNGSSRDSRTADIIAEIPRGKHTHGKSTLLAQQSAFITNNMVAIKKNICENMRTFLSDEILTQIHYLHPQKPLLSTTVTSKVATTLRETIMQAEKNGSVKSLAISCSLKIHYAIIKDYYPDTSVSGINYRIPQ